MDFSAAARCIEVELSGAAEVELSSASAAFSSVHGVLAAYSFRQEKSCSTSRVPRGLLGCNPTAIAD